MEHRYAQRHLDRFVDDELAGESVDRVTVHLMDCPECSAGVRFMLRVRAALWQMASNPPLEPESICSANYTKTPD